VREPHDATTNCRDATFGRDNAGGGSEKGRGVRAGVGMLQQFPQLQGGLGPVGPGSPLGWLRCGFEYSSIGTVGCWGRRLVKLALTGSKRAQRAEERSGVRMGASWGPGGPRVHPSQQRAEPGRGGGRCRRGVSTFHFFPLRGKMEHGREALSFS
jgi:hypothetical protein